MNLKKELKKLKITRAEICEKLGLKKAELKEIIETGTEEEKMDFWWRLLRHEIDGQLFERLSAFYNEFFANQEQKDEFIVEILSFKKANTFRRMINSIERLVSLADDIDHVRPGKDSLRIFFLVVCIESLYRLNKSKHNKIDTMIDFYSNQILEEDKITILVKVTRNVCDEKMDVAARECQLNMEIFARMINEIRNRFVHEGDYFNFSFARNEIPLLTHITMNEIKGEPIVEHVYDIGLSFEEFRRITVMGLIAFTRKNFEEEFN